MPSGEFHLYGHTPGHPFRVSMECAGPVTSYRLELTEDEARRLFARRSTGRERGVIDDLLPVALTDREAVLVLHMLL